MRHFSLAACLVFFALVLLPSVLLRGQDADSGEESAAGSPPAETEIFAPEGEPGAAEPVPVTGVEAVLDSAEELVDELGHAIVPGETLWSNAGRMGIALGIIAVQSLIIWVFWRHLFKFITRKAVEYFGDRIKPLTIKKLRILSTKQIISLIVFGIKIVKYILTVFLFVFTIPVVFVLFPGTRDLAITLFGYIFNPFKNIVFGAVAYIPNLITIAVIIIVTRYVLRALKFFAIQIEREKLVIPGFYADWANPTFNILRVLLYAFTVAIIYPYLPGSDSRIFQGVSVLVGVIFSLGSSSAIGNLVAGLVITYMRPFKIGDRIKLNDVTGFVVEKTLMVIRLKTHKNEYVTFPNLMILNSSVVNYHTSSDEDEEGLVLYATVTFGYGTPWQTVQEILINAALSTPYVLKNPKPFVLQTALNDFYANYQINCYSKEISMVPRIYSELYQNIQEGFRAAGIDMTAPQFRINMPYEDPFPIEISSPHPQGRTARKQAVPARPVDMAESGAGPKDAAPAAPEISAESGPANTRKAPVRRRSKSTPPSR